MALRIESIETAASVPLCTVLNYDRSLVNENWIAKLNFAIDTSMGIETYQKLLKNCDDLKPLNYSFLEQRDLHFFKLTNIE